MSNRAWAYIWAILLAGLLLTIRAVLTAPPSLVELSTFAALTVLASCAQLFKAEAPNHQTYYATLIFIFAALILLSPVLFVLLVIIAYSAEWLKERLIDSRFFRNWYLQPFNIATIVIAGLIAQNVYVYLVENLVPWFDIPAWVPAVTTAALIYVLLNHLMVGMALVLARGVSFHDSGILDTENLLTEAILCAMGYLVAVLWTVNFWLILPALSSLILMYRALRIPLLEHEAQTDSKTGLWNARHFSKLFAAELSRAARFARPLSFIMADLDLLRNINNTYGHLAGDAVLAEIGRIIRETIREYDTAARFGGEEFSIALPETEESEARAIAERLRDIIHNVEFQVASSPRPIHATMSFGVASFPTDGTGANELIHNADLAVYQAKLQGRNCVVTASQVPHSIKLEMPRVTEHSFQTYATSFTARPEPSTPKEKSEAKESSIRNTAPQAAARQSGLFLPLFVGAVIVAGLFVGSIVYEQAPTMDLTTVGILALFALLAEFLQINLYGSSAVSVALALNFATALIAGIPGVVIVGGAMALGGRLALVRDRRFLWRPALYKTPFNWAAYILSGSVPALALQRLGLHLILPSLPALVLMTIGCALVCYALETGLIASAISLETGRPSLGIWREKFRWLFIHYIGLCLLGLMLALAAANLGPFSLLVFALPLLMMRYAQKQYIDNTDEAMRELKRMNEELRRANSEITEASNAIRLLNDELFLTLSKLIDSRDPYVYGHAQKVADYASAIATEIGVPPTRIEQVRQAALLHDIGKIGISEAVLHKPGELTKEEYEYVQSHTRLGAELLETSRGLRHLAPIILHHHEWWNGSGYPDKLSGEETPLEARILAIADAVEAMASDRPYHRAMTIAEILSELKAFSAIQFDPLLVDVFDRIAQQEGRHLVVNSAREVLRRNGAARSAETPPNAIPPGPTEPLLAAT